MGLLKSVYANWTCDALDDCDDRTLALEAAERLAWAELGVDDDKYEEWCQEVIWDADELELAA